ncbi:MAG: catalase [Acidimicrobiales bacterium]
MAGPAAGTGWKEVFLGGSAESEARLVDGYTTQINRLQDINEARDGGPVDRAFHAGTLAAVTDAVFDVLPSVPADLAVGPFTAGSRHPAVVRLSSATGTLRHRVHGDLRGIAVRIPTDSGFHDLLMTNGPVSHARDVRQFMISAMAFTARWRMVSFARILWAIGPRETVRMLMALRRDTTHAVSSLALERYWTRAPYAVGPVAVKLRLVPVDAGPGIPPTFDDARLRTELVERLGQGPIIFELQAQRYIDEHHTPIEDASVEWKTDVARPEPIGRLTLPQQDLESSSASEREVDALSFNPWNTAGGIRPLGSSNRARQRVYASSAAHRHAVGT